MSGPIVRKYGFPNFEQIFGKRELEHGVEDAETIEGPHKEEKAGTSPSASSGTQRPRGQDRPVERS
jgi:hypothetical protein